MILYLALLPVVSYWDLVDIPNHLDASWALPPKEPLLTYRKLNQVIDRDGYAPWPTGQEPIGFHFRVSRALPFDGIRMTHQGKIIG
jgi:hypothetical protein